MKYKKGDQVKVIKRPLYNRFNLFSNVTIIDCFGSDHPHYQAIDTNGRYGIVYEEDVELYEQLNDKPIPVIKNAIETLTKWKDLYRGMGTETHLCIDLERVIEDLKQVS
jgi:hypothetical protein